jgi:hypothetical protein
MTTSTGEPRVPSSRIRGQQDMLPAQRRRAPEGIVSMRRTGLVLLGVVVALAGLLFTLQGVGIITGSAMSNTTFWSVAGPIIIVVGLVLAALGWRGRAR